jgi:hypothetical protein
VGSWRWGGPAWSGATPQVGGGLREVVVAVSDPDAVARRWAEVLDVRYDRHAQLDLAGGQAVRFTPEADAAGHGVVAATLALSTAAPGTAVVAGVRLDVVPLEGP